MKTYDITYKVYGYRNLCIKAESEEEAIQKANFIVQEGDFGELQDVNWDQYDIYEDKTFTD